ncbi:hypothetical protein Scep_018258 [Stephania cephalantha]|uniref:Sacsin/Nov domain-containing protein n=1 Tax=Stephania cephalantha TaxID=152367 RepID=A0AAP0IS29_9MAGN
MESKTTMSPRDHVEEIRRVKFSIGGEPNPVREDLHHAVKNLAGELYAKDVHFLMEIIQNAEDNEYDEGVKPALEFIVTAKDITDTGAEATLLIFNSEKGFSPKNVESICSIGRSTKKGQRKKGYIGEKGIGFKSVFLITAQPYIFSNGYQIKFSEEPCPECDIGYIVPEWVDESPTLADIREIYGSALALPTTTIILPLKSDKVEAVKQQLSNIHPEVLLFLSKIQHLSVREHGEDSKQNTVSAVSISSETELVVRKNIAAESFMLRLSAAEKSKSSETECNYYMWRQKFPVKHENRVDRRMEVDEWLITLAFPMERRLNRGTTSPGIYAFLPTEMVTNFPFIIQADFLLASSRETILLDNKWNQGILDVVPSAFASAFDSLVKGSEGVPASTLATFFNFLPTESSPYAKLNGVRDSIRNKIVQENIIPSESFSDQMFFHKPCEVGRMLPAFWDILTRARKQGMTLHNLSSNGKSALNSAFDRDDYEAILEFLGVTYMDSGCYIKCIQSSNMASGFPECDYLKLLCFLADSWTSFQRTNMKNVPLLRLVIQDGNISLLSVAEATQHSGKKICLSYDSTHIPWLIDWNKEFRHVANHFFMPKATQEALRSSATTNTNRERNTVSNWLNEHAGVRTVNVNDYAEELLGSLNNDRRLVLAFAHFVHRSLSKHCISRDEGKNLCKKMPLLVTNNSGCVTTGRSGVLVPAKVSKWVKLVGSNPWEQKGYVELQEDYLLGGIFAGVYSSANDIFPFLVQHVGASDIPYLCPPDDASFPAVYSPLTKENAFLLLDWVRNLRSSRVLADGKFLECIKEGEWLRTQIGCSTRYKPPSHSFLFTPDWGNLLQTGSQMVDIPLIDQGFYGNRISDYKEELKAIGVMSEFGEACKYIGDRLMHLASNTNLTRANVFSILNFIRFLRSKYLSPQDFINSIKGRKWLVTCLGERPPVECILYDVNWKAAAQISSLPFIDQQYYGEEILNFREELQLLGVVVSFSPSDNRVADNLRLPSNLSSLTDEAILLILQCIRSSNSSDRLVSILARRSWLKTSLGLKSPGECFLPDSEWGCILKVFNCFPLISQDFCGKAVSEYKSELKKLGVKVDLEEAAKAFTRAFKDRASSSSITKENVFTLLTCFRELKQKSIRIPLDLPQSICECKWLQTRLGLKTPKDSILFNSDWEHLLPISWLPFIDDTEKGYGGRIREYKDELKALGVTVEFRKGAKFITSGIIIPSNPAGVPPESLIALLKCIRHLLEKPSDGDLTKEFHDRINKKWLNTSLGYRAPAQCLLFGLNSSDLQRGDGPFISEEFYGSVLTSYKKELNAIGLTIDVSKGCQLIASELHSHSNFNTIARIYNYLMKFEWKPKKEDDNWIWIPNGSDDGEWVSRHECVLHDKDGLFGQQLNVLDKHYGKQLFSFFSSTLEVKNHPSVDDYWKLWSGWEYSRDELTSAECLAFWVFISKHWSSKTQKFLLDGLTKLPVSADADTVLLIDKDNVFIPDDLLLKHLFEGSSADPLFVWYPQRSSSSLPWTNLHGIYSSIGVRSISESVHKKERLLSDELLKEINPTELPIWKELIRLVLAFLADPSLDIDANRRQHTAKALLDLNVFETKDPILVSYSLELSSGKTIERNASRKIRWDRETSILFTQCMDRSSNHKDNIEFATYFSQVVAEGLLWDKEERIEDLSELIKLGWLLEFEEEAIGFLLKSKNLQLFTEDEEFLQSAFSQKSL